MKKSLSFIVLALISITVFAQKARKTSAIVNENIRYINRTIDIKDQLGFIFFKVINSEIYQSVMTGTIKGYVNDSLSSFYKHDCLVKKESRFESTKEIAETDNHLHDTSALNPFNIERGIKSYNLYEKLTFYKATNSFKIEILAIGLSEMPVVYDAYIFEQPLFWVKYDDLKSVLSLDELKKFNFAIFNSDILSLSRLVNEPVTIENSEFRIINPYEVKCNSLLKIDDLAGEGFAVAFNKSIDSLIKLNKVTPYKNDSLKTNFSLKGFYGMSFSPSVAKNNDSISTNNNTGNDSAKELTLNDIDKSHSYLISFILNEEEGNYTAAGKIEALSLRAHLYAEDVDFGITDVCWILLNELEQLKTKKLVILKDMLFNSVSTNLSKLPLPVK